MIHEVVSTVSDVSTFWISPQCSASRRIQNFTPKNSIETASETAYTDRFKGLGDCFGMEARDARLVNRRMRLRRFFSGLMLKMLGQFRATFLWVRSRQAILGFTPLCNTPPYATDFGVILGLHILYGKSPYNHEISHQFWWRTSSKRPEKQSHSIAFSLHRFKGWILTYTLQIAQIPLM